MLERIKTIGRSLSLLIIITTTKTNTIDVGLVHQLCMQTNKVHG